MDGKIVDHKKKKRALGSLEEKMGLDETSDYNAPPAPRPGLFPGSAAEELNERDRERNLGTRVRDRMTGRA